MRNQAADEAPLKELGNESSKSLPTARPTVKVGSAGRLTEDDLL